MEGRKDAVATLEQSFIDDLPQASPSATLLPSLAAAFLISFDLKVGYTIAWKRRSLPDREAILSHRLRLETRLTWAVTLDDVVEFKSLPSGLHNVKEDLVYFVHEDYAGVSAFVNQPASDAERNAHFIAVGVLVPLSYGRLGRSWLYAEKLRELARSLVQDNKKTELLEQFWEQHRAHDASSSSSRPSPVPIHVTSPPPQPNGHHRKRAFSSLTTQAVPGRMLPKSHPVFSIPQYINLFGPLLFPLHRQALLRKRILLVTQPPVQLAGEFVYNISVLSTINSALAEHLPPHPPSLTRLTPLFTIGVRDIPLLASTSNTTPEAWLACTTDEILTQKTTLYDVAVTLPSPTNPSQPRPRITLANGTVLLATQRDLRRWHSLQRVLHRTAPHPRCTDDETPAHDDQSAALLSRSPDSPTGFEDPDGELYDAVVEPTTWSALAYAGFMWWASSGQRDAVFDREEEQDRVLNGDLECVAPAAERDGDGDGVAESGREAGVAEEDPELHLELLAYFHRYSHQILAAAAEIVEAEGGGSEDEEGEGEGGDVVVGPDDLTRMGLDPWSALDRQFMVELFDAYFGRCAVVRGAGIECCGVRIC